MKKNKRNLYLAAFAREMITADGIERICTALGKPGGTESDAYCWLEVGRTEKEIVALLRKIGFDIPKEIVGSSRKKFDSTYED